MKMAWKANMGAVNIAPRSLHTERLILRPTRNSDAGRAFDIQSDWEVTRVLRTMSFLQTEEKWTGGSPIIRVIGRPAGLIAIVRANQDAVLTEPHAPRAHSSESLNAQIG